MEKLELRVDYLKSLPSKVSLSKKEYIQLFMKLYDNSNWIYEAVIPDFDYLKKNDTQQYTEQILLLKEGYYSCENVRERLKQKLEQEDGLVVRELYEDAAQHAKILDMQPWLNKRPKIVIVGEKELNSFTNLTDYRLHTNNHVKSRKMRG